MDRTHQFGLYSPKLSRINPKPLKDAIGVR